MDYTQGLESALVLSCPQEDYEFIRGEALLICQGLGKTKKKKNRKKIDTIGKGKNSS